jgi:hypothetical protein
MPQRTPKEITQLLNVPSAATPWMGDEAERDWATVIEAAILDKSDSAKKPGFTLYERNWLLIYGNWPLPGVDLDKAGDYLCQRLAGCWSSIPFAEVFIEWRDSLVQVSASRCAVHQLDNLWA